MHPSAGPEPGRPNRRVRGPPCAWRSGAARPPRPGLGQRNYLQVELAQVGERLFPPARDPPAWTITSARFAALINASGSTRSTRSAPGSSNRRQSRAEASRTCPPLRWKRSTRTVPNPPSEQPVLIGGCYRSSLTHLHSHRLKPLAGIRAHQVTRWTGRRVFANTLCINRHNGRPCSRSSPNSLCPIGLKPRERWRRPPPA